MRILPLAAALLPCYALAQTPAVPAGMQINPNHVVIGTTPGTVASGCSLAFGGTACRDAGTRAADVINAREYQAKGTGTVDDTSNLQNAATAAAGSTLEIPAGTYLLSSPILLSSTTVVRCDNATLIAPANTGLGNFFLNLNNTATTLTDHDITIEGCTFLYPNAALQNPDHAIEMHFVQHVHIRDNKFHGGGNATAMLGSDDVVTEGNYADGIQNACYDHWDGSSNFRTINNTCYLVNGQAGSFGVQGTGLSTALTDTPVSGAQIIGNRIYYAAGAVQGACIEMNASDTSSVTRAQIADNYCLVNSPSAGVNAPGGIQLAGGGGYNQVEGNIIEGATGTPSIGETDASQHDNSYVGNTLIGCAYVSPHQANIELNGIRPLVQGNKLVGCIGTSIYATDGAAMVSANDTGSGAPSSVSNAGQVQAVAVSATTVGGGSVATPQINASAIGPIGAGSVASVAVSLSGSYASPPTVYVPPPQNGGIQAVVAISDWGLSSVAGIADGGAGCTAGTILTPNGALGSTASVRIATVDGNGAATSIVPYGAGDLYVLPPSPAATTVASGTCTGRTPKLALMWYISGAKVVNPGSGYTAAPSPYLSTVASLGSGGALTTTLGGGTVALSGIPLCANATTGQLCAQSAGSGAAVQIK